MNTNVSLLSIRRAFTPVPLTKNLEPTQEEEVDVRPHQLNDSAILRSRRAIMGTLVVGGDHG